MARSFVNRNIEKLNKSIARKTSSNVPHLYDDNGSVRTNERILNIVIDIIDENVIDFNLLYDEVELLKHYIYDAFGSDPLRAASSGPSGTNGRDGNSHLSSYTFTVDVNNKLTISDGTNSWDIAARTRR